MKKKLLLGLLLTLVLGVLGAGIPAFLRAKVWWGEAVTLADQHTSYAVSHPGWSFPGRVYAGEGADRAFIGWVVGPDAEIRVHLPLEEAPPHLIQAILAAEDETFYEHHGVNFRALGRAVRVNLQRGGFAQGASTLTMQLVRGFNQQKEKTLERKLREVVMALAIDDHLGKSGVLQAYLDAPYLGQSGSLSICGFEVASRHYFGHGAAELTVSEAATLAGILPAPGRLGPDRDPEAAREKRDRVLRKMQGLFGVDTSAALAEPIRVAKPFTLEGSVEVPMPGYVSVLRAELEARLPPEVLYGSGLEITAAVDRGLQAKTDAFFARETAALDRRLGGRSAAPLQSVGVLVSATDGRLLAVWGGVGVEEHGFNRAAQARRQPGSAFKPVVYAMAFSQPPLPDGRPAWTFASLLPNQLKTFQTPDGAWKPRNIDESYHPNITIAFALSQSQNLATANLLERLGGPEKLIAFAQRVGFDTTKFPHQMGLALGQAEVTPLELARFYAAVAGEGRAASGTTLLRAVNLHGEEVIPPPALGAPVLTPTAAALTRDLMYQVIREGTGRGVRAFEGRPGYKGAVFGKTGTTDGAKDLWFVGGTPVAAGVLWIGFDQPTPLHAVARDVTAPMWGRWMREIMEGQEDAAFPPEPKLVHKPVCSETGLLANDTCWGIDASFVPGTEPKGFCGERHPEPLLPPEEGTGAEGAAAGEATGASAPAAP